MRPIRSTTTAPMRLALCKLRAAIHLQAPDPDTGRDEPTRLDTLQLDLGVIGPAAGGEFVQNNFHNLIGVDPAYGWGNQLHNEPTVGLTFERRWRTAAPY